MQFYDLNALDIHGNKVEMSQFKGKVILVVNTATQCGLTPQLTGLEYLHKKYQDKGLIILGFPCNQFGSQEPGENKDINQTCQINYGVSFLLFAKINVNGKLTHPVFAYLKKQLGGLITNDLKWNFTKFLIDKNGKPIKRFAPTKKPISIEPYLVKLLG
ncbi:MAG: glutathione peroxidase [bacterium]|nr:glutathione peroxidase [bacterium]